MASFTSVSQRGSAADPDYVYYNATIINNTVQTNQLADDPRITFQDTREVPIVKDSSKYDMSVENFTISGGQKSLPVFIPIINPTSPTDITTTSYSVSFGVYNGANYVLATRSIIWVPENGASFTVVPTTAIPNQSQSDYYYCYTYSHWVDLMNTALALAYADVVAQIGAANMGTACPFFEFDATTGLFSINQDANTAFSKSSTPAPQFLGYGNTPGAPFNIFGKSTALASTAGMAYQNGEYSFVGFNSNLEGLITNFDTVYYGYQGQQWTASGDEIVDGVLTAGVPVYFPENVVITIPQTNVPTVYTLPNPFSSSSSSGVQNYIRETQDFISTGSLWSPVASIVLATNQIPVRNEANANPVQIGSSTTGLDQPSSGAFQKVLIEVPINAITADLWRGFIYYEPLVPTFSTMDPTIEGIKNLDVSVFWRNRITNGLVPLRMYNQGTMSFRLCFKKKSAT